MEKNGVILLLLHLFLCCSNAEKNEHFIKTGVDEYCERDIFKPECGETEVILIKHARFGRMRDSSCITNNYGVIGCSMEARDLLDGRCSGRRSCEVHVVSVPPEDNPPCPKDFKGYLEVAYVCVEVTFAPKSYCDTSGAVEVREQHGYLSSLVTEETGCGSLDSPWWITVKPGQRLRLRLLNFGAHGHPTAATGGAGGGASSRVCHVYAIIKEEAVGNSETVCAGALRESLVYTSVTNMVEVRLVVNRKQDRDVGYFMLEYQAIGCPDPTPPTAGWIQRVGNDIYMGCNNTNEHSHRWKMRCEGSKWVGQTHNCTAGRLAAASSTQGWVIFNNSHGISIIVIIAIAVSVGLCILLIGLVYIRRHRRGDTNHQHATNYSTYAAQAKQRREIPQDIPNKNDASGADFYQSAENDYYRTWQMQRHGPAATQTTTADSTFPANASLSLSLPPPPYSSGSGTLASGSSSFPRNCPVLEHIYESPKFARKEFKDLDQDPPNRIPTEYYELDPDTNESARVKTIHKGGTV